MIAISTGIGLQQKIREKLSGFTGHIQVTNFDSNNSEITLEPVSKNQDFYPEFTTVSNVKNVQVFATKAGIIKKEVPIVISEYQEEVYGIFKEKAFELNSQIYSLEKDNLNDYKTDLNGLFQKKNINCVVKSLSLLKDFIITNTFIYLC